MLFFRNETDIEVLSAYGWTKFLINLSGFVNKKLATKLVKNNLCLTGKLQNLIKTGGNALRYRQAQYSPPK